MRFIACKSEKIIKLYILCGHERLNNEQFLEPNYIDLTACQGVATKISSLLHCVVAAGYSREVQIRN